MDGGEYATGTGMPERGLDRCSFPERSVPNGVGCPVEVALLRVTGGELLSN
jgi:hypothetical protein